MSWARRWLIEIPARIVQVWFVIYSVILTMICVVIFTVLAVALTLRACGIRWGW